MQIFTFFMLVFSGCTHKNQNCIHLIARISIVLLLQMIIYSCVAIAQVTANVAFKFIGFRSRFN